MGVWKIINSDEPTHAIGNLVILNKKKQVKHVLLYFDNFFSVMLI